MSALEFRNLLEKGDVDACSAFMAQAKPHLPRPASRKEAEQRMHLARTQVDILSFAARAYSHRWLTERNLPSDLPDDMRPRAERMYPKAAAAVGISCNSSRFPEAADIIRRAMENVVQECYADGDTSPSIVKPRMMRARSDETRRLFGTLVLSEVPRG